MSAAEEEVAENVTSADDVVNKGKVDFTEFQAAGGTEAQFAALDIEKTGLITLEELATASVAEEQLAAASNEVVPIPVSSQATSSSQADSEEGRRMAAAAERVRVRVEAVVTGHVAQRMRHLAQAASGTCAADEHAAQRMRSEDEVIRRAVLEEEVANTLLQQDEEEFIPHPEPEVEEEVAEVEEEVAEVKEGNLGRSCRSSVVTFSSTMNINLGELAKFEQEAPPPAPSPLVRTHSEHCRVLPSVAEEIEEIAAHTEEQEHFPQATVQSTNTQYSTKSLSTMNEFIAGEMHFPCPPAASH